MSARRKKWLIGIGAASAAGLVALFIAASVMAHRFEPYIREQAVTYLRDRFNSDVEIAALRVRLPKTSSLRILLSRGRGAIAEVQGEGIELRMKGRSDLPPMFRMRKFSFNVDIGGLFDTPKTVPLVVLDGMEINVPPKEDRPKTESKPAGEQESSKASVILQEVLVNDAKLVMLPRDKTKKPLRFDIHKVQLNSAGIGVAMKYHAQLTNPKPPGQIDSKGTFGPWQTSEPGDTPLSGEYIFQKADLGVFKSIGGILNSTGQFQGTLSSINVRGQASVPEFRLAMSGNPVPLETEFEVLVDGTNGNTILKPVKAMLGTTHFTTSGGIIKHEDDPRRTIDLDVNMPKGQLRDLLRLAMKGTPFMEGLLALKTRIEIPPLSGKVRERLRLHGTFRVTEGKFLQSRIQEKIDGLSRRGQGQPKSQEIDEVVSRMSGAFTLRNEVIRFSRLSFGVPGADVALKGSYDMGADSIDFRGTFKLKAKVSQTMTGWKRWALKPVDPFFAKEGAGTFLRIKIEGNADDPQFGLD
jgi:hypothetical protein